MNHSVITRFAPSPTGSLHLGSARTAIFNWLFSRHHGGKFLLRIEDTDRQRSTQESVQSLLQGLTWLGIDDYDGPIVYQSRQRARHLHVAEQLIKSGHAYRCYCSPQELEEHRQRSRKLGKPLHYSGKCRDLGACVEKRGDGEARSETNPESRSESQIETRPESRSGARPEANLKANFIAQDRPHTIRLKTPKDRQIIINDLVQGEIIWHSRDMDDFVLVRSDGTPTYMLSVVADDHDMGVTHVIRGSDHLSNTPKQYLIYQAMGWRTPQFAHIPLIHAADNTKLSKRHGAISVREYQKMGLLPDALFNYLLRLGWSYGDREIISRRRAVEIFDTNNLGCSSSKFDLVKLLGVNKHYMQNLTTSEMMEMLKPFWRGLYGVAWNEVEENRLKSLMGELKIRNSTLLDLAMSAGILRVQSHIEEFSPRALGLIRDNISSLRRAYDALSGIRETEWHGDHIRSVLEKLSSDHGIKRSDLAQSIRAALTGKHVSPGIYDILHCLGKGESLQRMAHAAAQCR